MQLHCSKRIIGADVAINYLLVEEPDAREVIEPIRREGRKAVALPGHIREQFDTTFKTKVYAMFWITKATMPHLNLKTGSAIINTASVDAYDPGEDILDYASTKGAIAIFTKSLAKQVEEQGIRVNAVAPLVLGELDS